MEGGNYCISLSWLVTIDNKVAQSSFISIQVGCHQSIYISVTNFTASQMHPRSTFLYCICLEYLSVQLQKMSLDSVMKEIFLPINFLHLTHFMDLYHMSQRPPFSWALNIVASSLGRVLPASWSFCLPLADTDFQVILGYLWGFSLWPSIAKLNSLSSGYKTAFVQSSVAWPSFLAAMYYIRDI